jgi:6-phosphofructokinase 1
MRMRHDRSVRSLGDRTIRSPLRLAPSGSEDAPAFTPDDARVLREIELPRRAVANGPRAFEMAGPRENIFFDPKRVTVGIVTAGGICPGINDVIRGIVLELRHAYGVERILGFRFGLGGLVAEEPLGPIALDPALVRDIHIHAGTFLGTSRGTCDAPVLVDGLVAHHVDILFVIGGDGTMRAAHALHEEIARRSLALAVVGIPKTIDNDIAFVDKTFGFDTAVATARLVIEAAHAEARSVHNGIGLVKLMGRTAGFIAAQATLASHEVNACLIPESRFELEGEGGFLAWLERRLTTRHHAVLVVGEGCASRTLGAGAGAGAAKDASGNVRFDADGLDVGRYLKHAIEAHLAQRRIPSALKYIDPSYLVRATRPSAEDAVFCDALARNAVHAGLAGKTDVMVGRWHRCFTHVSLEHVLAHDKRVDPAGELWREVLSSTGQPAFTNAAFTNGVLLTSRSATA